MSREYKLNKSELTRLKRQEKLYMHYLPVLKLKLEQLQIEQNRIRKNLIEARLKSKEIFSQISPYLPCFSDAHAPSIAGIVVIEDIKTINKSVAGILIKTLQAVNFKNIDLPYFHTVPWLVRVRPLLESYVACEVNLRLLEEENNIINRELRKAMQKVNLFDMVLIPHTKEAIRRIKIALGDEQVASVSRGKIAKGKKIAAEILEIV
jgi:V/A-type H+/Na+-transporting ATPase subunit D